MTTKKKAARKTTTNAKARKASPTGATNAASAKRAKKAATAPAAAKDATRAAPVRRPPKEPKLSAVKAAVQVLADAPPEGMSAKEMVDAMAEAKLWTSPGGKTPEASLYASIIREIAKKGTDARFRKVARGRFVLNAG